MYQVVGYRVRMYLVIGYVYFSNTKINFRTEIPSSLNKEREVNSNIT